MKIAWVAIIVLAITVFSFYIISNQNIPPKTEEDGIVLEFLNDILNDGYKPSNINMTNRLTQDNRADGSTNQYGSIWYNDDEKLYAVIHYNDLEKKVISDLYFVAFLNELPDILSKEIASSYFDRYFKNTNSDEIDCGNESNISYCEAFWEGNDKNKMGMAVISSASYNLVVFCKYPVGSINYELSTCMQTI